MPKKTHPCARANPPAFCTKKRKKAKKMDCACPSGWERSGIMCHKGRQVKRATCKKKPKRR
jgi:hypothetical protein